MNARPAEAPADAEGVEDITALAMQSAGAPVDHVGTLYGLLGVVFSTPQEIAAGGSGSAAWDAALRLLEAAAHQQSPAASWHLDDDAIDARSLERQAAPASWERGGNHVFLIASRAEARDAIRNVAEEGEGMTGDDLESHFARLRSMFRGRDRVVPFPAAGEWVPALAVPTDPRPEDVAEQRTRRWMQLADIRYGLLLGFIEHHLLTSDREARATFAGWAFDEMFSLAMLAQKLATLPLGAGVGAVAFTLPALQHLPAGHRG